MRGAGARREQNLVDQPVLHGLPRAQALTGQKIAAPVQPHHHGEDDVDAIPPAQGPR